MKLIIVRLLLPNIHSSETPNTALDHQSSPPQTEPAPTQSSQARIQLALQEREAAAILIHVTTLAPQTPYSTPALAWRPDGSGVWVNADDGVVRGIETHTGKIVATLKDGHQAGVKVRCLWAGRVRSVERAAQTQTRTGGVEEGKEVVISGGFDHRLVVWNVDESQG